MMKVEAKHISIVFNNAYLIKQKNFCLENMHAVLLQGNNGTGKTTLIKALAGIKSLDAGEINYFSNDIQVDKKTFQKKLGLCLGVQFLCLDMTLEENLSLYYEKFYQDAYVKNLLKSFSLNHKLQQPLNTLSKGELQKSALCRALLFDPEVVFLDEPFDGLDQTAQKQLKKWIEDNKHKKSILLCTHINKLPESFFDQVWDLNQ